MHTLMEVDSHPSPSPSSPSRLRGPPGLSLATFRHHHPTRMSKRARSPEAADTAGRPLKRAAGDHILATTSSSGRSSRQQSEDWVQQAGGLRIDSLAEGNYLFASLTGIGPGPSTSTQTDEDVAMAVEEDTAGLPPFQEEGGQENAAVKHPLQLIPPQGSHSMPNPGLPSHHPYGQHWLQQRARNVDGSLLINVVPATPADSQQSLSVAEAPTGQGVEQHRPPTPNHMLQALRVPRESPPLSGSTGIGLSTPPLVQHDLSPFNPTGKNKRVAFGPRLNCEKCRLGEIHFTHVHYE